MGRRSDGEPTGQPTDASPVLVVGAGPAGLLLAAELSRRDVPCELIEARAAPLHWDRATVVHPRSLELFDSLGLCDQFLDAGTPQRGCTMFSDGDVVAAFDLADIDSRFHFNVGVSEEVTESILTNYLHQQGGVVTRSSQLTGLHSDPEGVVAEVEHDSGREKVEASWVVGCDGLHSRVRETSGIGFEGHDIADPWAVFDTTIEEWPERFDLTFVYFEEVPVILTALPEHRWRVYLRPSSTESDLVQDAMSTIGRYHSAVSFADVQNPTRFHCHTKVATQFRSGRVLLAGDAAHLCSPAQGHGMNCGLQDAANLAWKLALVHRGEADPRLLDSYGAERRPIAQAVGQSGDDVEHLQNLTGPAERDSRNRALRATFAQPSSRHHEAAAEAELNLDCVGSPIVSGDTSPGLSPGQRLPDTVALRGSDEGPGQLHELAHRAGHTLMLLGGPTANAGALIELHEALSASSISPPLFEATVALGAGSSLPETMSRLPAAAAERLGVNGITLLAVRPDGYIGLRADSDHLNALERYRALVLERPDGRTQRPRRSQQKTSSA